MAFSRWFRTNRRKEVFELKNLIFRFSGLIVAFLVVVAQISPLCLLGHYQPEVPASLRK